jgi:hypothetical protein
MGPTGTIMQVREGAQPPPGVIPITRRERRTLLKVPKPQRAAKLEHVRGRARAKREAARMRARTGTETR